MYNNCTSECLGYISTCNWPKQLTTQRKSYKVNKKNRTKSYKTVHVHSWFRPSCCSTQQGEFVLSLQEINPWQSNPSLFLSCLGESSVLGIFIDMEEENREHQTGDQELSTGAHCHGDDQVGMAGIMEALLRSPSALQALGGALAPLFGSINPSTLGNMSRTVAEPQPPWVPSRLGVKHFKNT